ncbi:hypothetical protein ACH4P7_001469 [Enterobacter hormaechei]|uniref:hypothetical protein n=1 Tax=Enterobacter TaxID=547 RepID=UPI001C63BFD9|nr:hypothetical protein [Enterobacter hormaechei]MBW7729054.1 hypothetical protein [Enterobacter hormaechei]HCM9437540.1 hypothetical protein [Enterobacter hormaechei subsp. xiangfangensis]
MAKTDSITPEEFRAIHFGLSKISSTWADLWLTLFYLRAGCRRVITIRYSDIEGDMLHLAGTPRFEPRTIRLNLMLSKLFAHRKDCNPSDIYVFQSRSNRVKALARPVTVIAMNNALKQASKYIIGKNITMKSALRVIGGK